MVDLKVAATELQKDFDLVDRLVEKLELLMAVKKVV